MKFIKMHGCGNDYVLVDGALDEPGAAARYLCNRRFGVGADGLITLEPAPVADAMMRIFNADGSEAEMCGNGIRCAALHLSAYQTDVITIETLSGRKVIRNMGGNLFEVEMGKPEFPGNGEAALDVKDRVFSGTRVSMGNPHFVVFVDDVEEFPVDEYGPLMERLFEKGTNVEFVHVTGKGGLRQRTWERGVGETLACGTGACAAAAVAIEAGKVTSPVKVALTGGSLTIRWDGEGPIFMAGEAVEVFRGEVHLP